MAIKWNDDYRTGVEEVDKQHRQIFEYLNSLEQLVAEGIDRGPQVDKLLGSLASDTQTHFSFEEGCMMRLHCPAAQENETSHKQFLTILANFTHEYETEGSSAQLLKRFHKLAEDWLAKHICNVDIHLRSCLNRPGK